MGGTFRKQAFGNRDFGRLDWFRRLLDSPESVCSTRAALGSRYRRIGNSGRFRRPLRGLSGTTSLGSAVGVPSEVDMTGTSRGSLAGEPASADGNLINAGGGGRSSLARSAGGPSSDAIVEGWAKQRGEVG